MIPLAPVLGGCAEDPPGRSHPSDASRDPVDTAGPVEAPPNLLLVIADDLGPVDLAPYGLSAEVAATPVLDSLAAEGVTFTRAYADPICSPTRATLQTGRYGFRVGITDHLVEASEVSLPLDEVTLPEALRDLAPVPYDAAMFGKWHLAGASAGLGHPNDSGWPWFQGKFIGMNRGVNGERETYTSWDRVTNGTLDHVRRYATSVTVDDALAHLPDLAEPWVMVVAFNAPHEPLHWPPVNLWTGHPVGATDEIRQYHAMIEAMDTELGRLLDGLGDAEARTNVVFVGDNGPWRPTATPPVPPRRAKGTIFEGGTHVPLVVSGPAVSAPGRTSDALVGTVDVFATLLDLARVPDDAVEGLALDGVSFAPVLADPRATGARAFVYTEILTPPGPSGWTSGARAVQDERWKLIERVADGTEAFADLSGTFVERADLLQGPLDAEQQAALDRLRAAWPFPLH